MKIWVEPKVVALDINNTHDSTMPDGVPDGAYGDIFVGTGVNDPNKGHAGTICPYCS